jgi:serine/threonine protein kinase/formylglycine-generating enzyme required for sulfatase activity
MTLAPGTKLGRYEIRSKIGAGGMGEVYLAQDTKLNRKVAIKVLPLSSQANKHANQRLLREARAAANLDHSNICSIHEVAEEDDRTFICMQYVEGETLDARMKRKSLDLTESLSIAIQIVDALAEAHAHGTIHRDIKPSNVMITARGMVKVMDFGLAKLMHPDVESEAETEARISTPGAIIGTVPYMSPEQVRGEALDGRSDIFSFGVVLYEMLSGQQPFACQSSAATASAILTREPLPLARFAPDAPAELERIVHKALRKEADERYQTAKDLLIDLKNLRTELEFQHRLERSVPPDSARQPSIQSTEPRATRTTAKHPLTHTIVDSRQTTRQQAPSFFNWIARAASTRSGLIAIAVVAIVAFGGWLIWHTTNVRWARRQVPRIEGLANAGKYSEAYDLAVATQKYLPDDPTIGRLMPTISDTLSVTTEPAGASVYLARFAPEDASKLPARQMVGATPINSLRIARGQYILYVEKDGYAKTERTISGALLRNGGLVVQPPPVRIEQKLLAADKVPDGMTFVPGSDYRLVAWARPTDARVRLDDFFIDKYEVSNQNYKDFINAGGYLKKQYWKYPFVKDGKTLSWEAAIGDFTDRTGLPGPRSWSNQNFPEGKAEYPVTDISWYEAAAYAAFRGKQLPTIFQWEKAARNGQVTALGPYLPWGFLSPGDTLENRANFDDKGTLPVSSSEFGMSPFGAYNMAGNVSEWTLNETSEGFIATGGAWGDPLYTFAQYGTFPGFYNSNKRGFRCALNAPNTTGNQGAAFIEIKNEIPVYTPSSDASFNQWLNAYRYQKTPLDAQVVEVKETDEWRREKISFNGADNERAIAYLYLPKNFPRPLQVLHVLPAGDVDGGLRSLPDSIEDRLAPFIKSGRAVFGVVLKGYIERLRPAGFEPPDTSTVEYRELIVNRITDVRRGLDYLITRDDVDARRIVFFGPSSGAIIGLILAAVEDRYASVFLQGAGVRYDPQRIAEADPINFAPHIRPPKLMLHGRYDEDTPLKTRGEPLFKLLREPKRLILYDGGHIPPLEFFVTTMNTWLDETLGPVKRE